MKEQTYLVTGGTGFLGSHLVPLILAERNRVRLYCRKAPANEDVPAGAEVAVGSLTDVEALTAACRGCEGVFHLAGEVVHSREESGARRMWVTNVEGTECVMKAALAAGCRRVVYASSSGVVGCAGSFGAVATDSSPYCSDIVQYWPYYVSKIEAERRARSFAAASGLELVCMRPTMMWGPGDDRFRSTKLVLSFVTRHLPFIPPGGSSVVDIRDAAQAFLVAMTRGRSGASYLLGAYNGTMLQLFELLERLTGVPKPAFSVPGWVARSGAVALDFVNRRVRGNYDPSVDPVRAEMGCHFWSISSDAARRDLGFSPRPIRVTIADTLSFMAAKNPQLKLRAKL